MSRLCKIRLPNRHIWRFASFWSPLHAQKKTTCCLPAARGRGIGTLLRLRDFGRNPYACALTRDKVLTRTKGVFSLSDADFTGNDRSGIADVCFAARIPLELPAHGEKSVTMFLCCGRSQAEISSVIGSLRTEGAPPAKNAARAAFCDDTPKSAAANAFLPALFSKPSPRRCK